MRSVWTVSSLTRHIRLLIEADEPLAEVWVEGEVSNFTRASSGHIYFTLKDEAAQIRCVMWRSDARRQEYIPQHGDAILAHGRIGVYEAGGVYQLYCDYFQPAGLGELHRQFEMLKARLEAEGLFSPERKRQIPTFPRTIGVVTSPDAAAYRDIQNVLRRRYPLVRLVLSPSLVQGEDAPAQIVAAIRRLNRRDDIDVIIVARGGGSLEDLWAFNDERVARAIAGSRIPVISGVGHETDFTIADFAADVRAPTPSAAAELAVPDRSGLLGDISVLRSRLTAAMRDVVARCRREVRALHDALGYLSPATVIAGERQQLDSLIARMSSLLAHDIHLRRERLRGLMAALATVSPARTLRRGYAVISAEDGTPITSVSQVSNGDRIRAALSDGSIDAIVERGHKVEPLPE